MIRFNCPTCGATLTVRPELAGRRGHCPGCKGPVTVPAPEATGEEPMVLAPAGGEDAPERKRLTPLSRRPAEAQPRPRRDEPEPEPEERAGKKTLWIALGGLAGAVAAGVGVWLATRGGPAPETKPQEVVKAEEKQPALRLPKTHPRAERRYAVAFQAPGATISDEAKRLPDPQSAVLAFVPLPNGRVLWSETAGLRVLDPNTGQTVHALAGHAKGPSHLAVTPDGRRAVSGSTDRTARVWDLEAGRELARFEKHAGVVTSVAVSPDGARAATCNYSVPIKGKEDVPNYLYVWDCETGVASAGLAGTADDPILKAFFHPDGKRLILYRGRAEDTPPRLTLWEPGGGAEEEYLDARSAGHGGTVDHVIPVQNGERLVTRSTRAVIVLETATGRPLVEATMPVGPLPYVAFAVAPDGRHALHGGMPPIPGPIGPAPGPFPKGPFPGPSPFPGPGPFPGPPTQPGAFPNTGAPQVPLVLLDLNDGREVCRFLPKPGAQFFKAAFMADGKSFLTSSGRDALLWDLPTPGAAKQGGVVLPKELPRTEGLPKDPEEEPWPEFPRTTLAHQAPPDVPVQSSPTRPFTNLGPMTHVAALEDGRFAGVTYQNELVSWGKEGQAKKGGAAGKLRHPADVFAVAPGGRALMAGGKDHTVLSCDLSGQSAPVPFQQHQGRLSSAALSPDGTLALTCNFPPAEAQNDAILWEAATGRVLARAPGTPDDPVVKAFFHPDGRRVLLARGNRGGTGRRLLLYLWDPETNASEPFFNARRVGLEAGVISLFAAPGGKQIVLCGRQAVCVADVEKRLPVRQIAFPQGSDFGVFALSPDGKHLACAGRMTGNRASTPILIADLDQGKEVGRYDPQGAWFLSAAFTPDGKQLVAVSRHSPPALWDFPPKKK